METICLSIFSFPLLYDSFAFSLCVACALCVSIALHEKFVAQNHLHVS